MKKEEYKELQINKIIKIDGVSTVYYSGTLMIPDRVDVMRYLKESDKNIATVNFRRIAE